MNSYVVARQAVYWIFPSATERTAYVANPQEVTKVAWQQSDDSLWFLKAAPGTWVQVSVPASVNRYEHTQGSASATWVINHNLGRNVQAEVYTVGGLLVAAEIAIMSVNQIEVRLDAAAAGFCVIS